MKQRRVSRNEDIFKHARKLSAKVNVEFNRQIDALNQELQRTEPERRARQQKMNAMTWREACNYLVY